MNQLIKSVEQLIESTPNIDNIVIAYSGGIDSHVLLHVCAVVQTQYAHISFLAVYIDHGLHIDSTKWRVHCEKVSFDVGVNFSTQTVNAIDKKGEGPEQAARHARYDALREYVDGNTILLTAQHQDDQAETLLLQLLRGAGVNGLASMPRCASFGSGLMMRPFLAVSKQDIVNYAEHHKLDWVEDPSNKDVSFSRNFLRQEVIPLIQQKWPAFSKTTARTASHCAEITSLLSDYASLYFHNDVAGELALNPLRGLSNETQRLVIRQWLISNDVRLPSQKVLNQMQMIIQDETRQASLIEWGGYQLRLFKNTFYILHHSDETVLLETPWQGERVDLPNNLGQLAIKPVVGLGIKKVLWDDCDVFVRSRLGGERIKLAGRSGTKSLKKLLNESSFFPWVRDSLPLIFINNTLVAVADIWMAEKFLAKDQEQGYEIEWQHPTLRIK
ncbi:MAG: tRNA lysidine(34) synthetase TilS [Cycloclasticus sp.]|nr:MAG: tRNA lysidine(34) synthetase TilS [Cycloclasticus sp.]